MNCQSCQHIMESKGLTSAILLEEVERLHTKVVQDLEKKTSQLNLKVLKHKKHLGVVKDEVVKSEVKEEPADPLAEGPADPVAAQPEPAEEVEEDDWKDAELGKQELARLGKFKIPRSLCRDLLIGRHMNITI